MVRSVAGRLFANGSVGMSGGQRRSPGVSARLLAHWKRIAGRGSSAERSRRVAAELRLSETNRTSEADAMTTEPGEDTGTIAEVPEDQRLDVDEGEGSDATDGGLDDDLDDVYADTGEPTEEPFA